ncbi:MAG: hypothetical protein O6766_04410 [Gammaproteobacteria bacterium]|nr:hypothetical protein [Gammaproteobacteria bacterium]
MKFINRLLAVLVLTCIISVPAMAGPEGAPSAEAVAIDIIVARPLGVVITGVGAALFIVSLPFSLLGGNVGEAGKALVGGPAKETFMRCLGCSRDRSGSYTN